MVLDNTGTTDNGAGKDAPQNGTEQQARPALKPCAIVAQLNRAYLRAIVQAWEEQQLTLIEALGLPIPLARRLATSPGIVLDRLGQFRSPVAQFEGDATQIERLLDHQMKQLAIQNQVDEMLQLGATVSLVMQLTGFSAYEVQSRLEALQLVGKGQGAHRSTLLSIEEMKITDAAWKQHRHLPPMEHWIAVARATGISIRRLHASYRKYDIPMPGERPIPFASAAPANQDGPNNKNNKPDAAPAGATA